jgi:hypothetical protein
MPGRDLQEQHDELPKLHLHRAGLRVRVFVASLLALSLGSATALAQSPAPVDKARAKEAYDRAVEAHRRGDYQRAAEEFARADAAAPSPVALGAALDDAVEADDPALGSELIERSRRGPSTPALDKSLEAAKKKFGGRAGRVKVACPAGSSCLATLDGVAIDVGKPAWARAGQHTVVVQVDGNPQTKLVEVKVTEVTEVAAEGPPPKEAPPPIAPPPPREQPPKKEPAKSIARDGLPPIVFWAGLGATVLLGGAATVIALDTKAKHSSFVKAGCDKAPEAGCDDKKSTGESEQTVANAAFAATAVVGVATVVVGLAFTDWRGRKKTAISGPIVAPVGGGATAGWVGRF